MTDLTLASEQVDPLIDALDLSDEVRAKATELAEQADYEWPVNRAPSSVAAGAVYAAALLCNEKRTQRVVSEVADVSETSIRESYQELLECDGYTHPADDETMDAPQPSRELLRRIRRWMFP